MSNFPLPSNTQSILLIGKNGSGKTRAAVWHLAQKDLRNETWVVINHKREELINSIPGAVFMSLDERPGRDAQKKVLPGIFVYQPRQGFDDEAVTELLWWVYETENVGVYIDEGYMISPRDHALNTLYTQGRSKHIPIITLSQRPSKISRFAVSEAGFLQVFYLTDRRDRQILQEFIPYDFEPLMNPRISDVQLPDFHSVYYPTGGREVLIMRPVPDDASILAQFAQKLPQPEPELIAKFRFI